MKLDRTATALLTGLILVAGLPAAAVVDGQIDTFESATTESWSVGAPHPAPPQNVATGGPDGAGDHFLLLTSLGGFGAGSRLASFNQAQWSGDYLTAGVGALLVDVNNLGNTDLLLRLMVTDGSGQFATHAAVSTDAVFVPSGSGWITVAFRIRPSDLTAQVGTAADALSDTAQLWIFHNDTASFPPDAVTVTLGIDNIEALPEPSAQAALGTGLALLAWLDRRRVTRRGPRRNAEASDYASGAAGLRTAPDPAPASSLQIDAPRKISRS